MIGSEHLSVQEVQVIGTRRGPAFERSVFRDLDEMVEALDVIRCLSVCF